MRKSVIIALILLIASGAFAQDTYYPTGHHAYNWLERRDVLNSGKINQNLLLGLAGREAVADYYKRIDTGMHIMVFTPAMKREQQISNYLQAENLDSNLLSTHSFLGLYKYPAAFYGLKKQDEYAIAINPVLGLSAGMDQNDSKRKIYQNTRGAELRGNIGGKNGVGFYTFLSENQFRFPRYVDFYTDSIGVTPNELYWKPFKQKATDFFQARGYVTFSAAKYIHFQFGHDKNFIGSGYRSLILSDFAPQYLFLKINTSIGRFNYQNLFTQFTDYSQLLGNTLFRKKYGAFHRLGFNVTDNFNIGLNEMVIFDRQDDSTGHSTGYDLNYLNPVIFYRAVETNLGSRDNAMLALDWKWNFLQRFSFYGQAVLDEFVLKQFKNQPDWWGNKYGYQLGLKYFNVLGISNLDAQAEYNHVRPYTYSHYRTSQSYSNFNQALAHPLGANFSEWVMILRYQPVPKLTLTLTQILAQRGIDSSLNGNNYGSNILRDNDSRVSSNSPMLQGEKQTLSITDVTVNYMLKHNLFIDAKFMLRTASDANLAPTTTLFNLGLRLNLAQRKLDY